MCLGLCLLSREVVVSELGILVLVSVLVILVLAGAVIDKSWVAVIIVGVLSGWLVVLLLSVG